MGDGDRLAGPERRGLPLVHSNLGGFYQPNKVGAKRLISEKGYLERYLNRNIPTGLFVNKSVLLCVMH